MEEKTCSVRNLFLLFFLLESERCMETYGWTRNSYRYTGYRTLYEQVSSVNWLEPHAVCLVIANVVDVGDCCSVWKFCYYYILWHQNLFISVRWYVAIVDASP